MQSKHVCTHPDHKEGENCLDRAVSCHPDCICCNGIEGVANNKKMKEAKLEDRKLKELKIKLEFEISKMGIMVPIQCSPAFDLSFSSVDTDSPMYVMIRRTDYNSTVGQRPPRNASNVAHENWAKHRKAYMEDTHDIMCLISSMIFRLKLSHKVRHDRTSLCVSL